MKKYDISKIPPGKCLECGSEIEYARPNKKFCCETCKNHYNNRLKAYHQSMKYRIDSALDHNYTFLNKLLYSSITEIPVNDAIMSGFNLSYVTSSFKMGRKTEYCCYDIAFRISDTKIFNIHRLCINLRNKSKKI